MAEPLWTAEEIAAACDGQVINGGFAATGISIDSRSIDPGDLFIALAGVRDGHEFTDMALKTGASGLLVSQDVAGPAVRVADTFIALEKLGVAARDRAAGAIRGAVTGSVGKTSVTQAVRAGLALAGRQIPEPIGRFNRTKWQIGQRTGTVQHFRHQRAVQV